VPTGHVRYHGARRQSLFDDPRLVVIGETTSSPRSSNYLKPTDAAGLRLKRMVKRRHKPISDSEIEHLQQSPTEPKGGLKTSLTIDPVSGKLF
jgi:hypothetical protein